MDNTHQGASASAGLSKYVTLISSDGFEFVVLREAACISGAIKRMLDPKSKSSLFHSSELCSHPQEKPKPVYLRTLLTFTHSGIVLEKVAEYFYYNYKNRDREDVPDMEIPPELCLELLMAADFLDT
ncbi:hypothetical protein HYALB_00013432 [Hymenoscyphus albidus]|uniref:Elongin-C n=1 Tax=Hymenoscyphus albidus TaxID=595503 RepID=A0A9N9Q0S2_9HELO|nr:hypothetical protein HYALB_00013432 [Hymenoscyphus albidus]